MSSNKVNDTIEMQTLDKPNSSGDSRISNLVKKVEEKTKNYDSNANKDPYSKPGLEKIGYFALIMRFASTSDKVVYVVSVLGMIGYGIARPLFSVLYGKTTGNSTQAESDKDMNTWAVPVFMMGIGLIAGLFKLMQVAGIEIFSDSVTHKIRLNYFKSVIGKDSSWFDANNPNEIAAKVATETDLI